METYFLLFENLSFGVDIPYTDHGFNQHLVIVPDLHQLSIIFIIFTFLVLPNILLWFVIIIFLGFKGHGSTSKRTECRFSFSWKWKVIVDAKWMLFDLVRLLDYFVGVGIVLLIVNVFQRYDFLRVDEHDILDDLLGEWNEKFCFFSVLVHH
tara:strand:- start:115 stop:570 length:456 start_codon:yes stop_codon:yes gene_type:complete